MISMKSSSWIMSRAPANSASSSSDFREFYTFAGRDRGVPVWRIGCGANMAFRRAAFAKVGLFDTRLGAGASGCSEDSELWYRLLATGGVCHYEPSAVVYHYHRSDWSSLRRQAH